MTPPETRIEKQIHELREALNAFQIEVKKGLTETNSRLTELEDKVDDIRNATLPRPPATASDKRSDCGLG